MFIHIISFIKKYKKYLINSVASVILLAGAVVLLAPQTHLKLGDYFFGGATSFYNVNLAQHFYAYAAYSPVAKAPQYAHYQLSRTYFIQGRLQSALFEAQSELALYPDNVRTYYILGLTYGYMNREQEAVDAFSVFIRAYPHSWAARNDKAWLQFRLGDIEAALATIESVAQVQNPWVQNTYGTLLLNLERHAEAKQAFAVAYQQASLMTEAEWGGAYPGNDPRVYELGLQATKQSIKSNLELLNQIVDN
jgi:tetratricopeptide (TPR) repeat protein